MTLHDPNDHITGTMSVLEGKILRILLSRISKPPGPQCWSRISEIAQDAFLITHNVREAWLCYDCVHYRDKKPELTGKFVHQWERMSRDFHINLFQNLFL